uniref:Uncharacterized protein n=1 Tax=Medicago truncatula TaxID=3880 RepID=I3SUK2_MEDTR|nr:unknown [Medicago truncatula]
MRMDLTLVATIWTIVGELLGRNWITLAVPGHAALIQLAQSLTTLLIFSIDLRD